MLGSFRLRGGADHAPLEELWCVRWRGSPDEEVALALRVLDAPAGEIEIARIDFDADEGPAELDAGDARGAAAHERVAHGLAGVAAPIDEPIEVDLGAAARVAVGRPVDGFGGGAAAGDDAAAGCPGDRGAEPEGEFVTAHGATEIVRHDVGKLQGTEEGEGVRDGGEKAWVAVGPQDGNQALDRGQGCHGIPPEAVRVVAAWNAAGRAIGPDRIGDDDVDPREPGQQLACVTPEEGDVAEFDAFDCDEAVHALAGQKVPGGPP
jgi:hypothetical protein